jgi:hypothetical protein
MANSRRSMGCPLIFFVGGIGSGIAAIIVSSSMTSALEQGGTNFYFSSYLPALFLWVVRQRCSAVIHEIAVDYAYCVDFTADGTALLLGSWPSGS